MKSQSAMEYLMTYGWAILIIAVVLGVLYQLGVFTGSNLVPGAQAGSCQVQKAAGVVSLVGECTGQLPLFVGKFSGNGGSYISLPTSGFPTGTSNRTISLWILQNNLASRHYAFSYCGIAGTSHTGLNLGFNIYNPGDFGEDDIGSGKMPPTQASLSAGTWYNIIMTFGIPGNTLTYYLDGTTLGSNTDTLLNTNTPIAGAFIGSGENPCASTPNSYWVPGMISNVQLYNVSLSAAEAQTLYQEGIGGPPIRPQNLVGWWPLNGNADDYSGNGNNGNAVALTYSSTWQSGYTAP